MKNKDKSSLNSKIMIQFSVSILYLFFVSCYLLPIPIPESDYVGQVVDEETGEPIEGAIAMARWLSKNPKDASPYVFRCRRLEEVRSDKEGKLYIKDFWKGARHLKKGPYTGSSPYIWGPHLRVFKPGYVCWDYMDLFIPVEELRRIKRERGRYASNDYSYRTDFGYKDRTIRMEKWNEAYGHRDHRSFIERGIILSKPDGDGREYYSSEFLKEATSYEGKFVLEEDRKQKPRTYEECVEIERKARESR